MSGIPKVLQEFEVVELSTVDIGENFLQVNLDLDKLVEAWAKAGYPETWKPQTTKKS